MKELPKFVLGSFLAAMTFMFTIEAYAAVYRVIHYGWGAF